MKKILTTLLTLCLLLCSSAALAAGDTDISNGTVSATGYGVCPEGNYRPMQARILARKAAIADAQRLLAEAVYGVNIDAATTVQNAVVTNDSISTHVSGLIKNSTVTAENCAPDGTYEITLSMPVYGLNSLAQTLFQYNAAPEPFPAPTETDGGATLTEGCYTGVIIDCSGLGLETAMSPVILNEQGEKLYGYQNLDYRRVIKQGMAAYAQDSITARRAGSNPLRLRAVSVEGRVNPVLSAADANRMLEENRLTHFLDYCNVVFVR